VVNSDEKTKKIDRAVTDWFKHLRDPYGRERFNELLFDMTDDLPRSDPEILWEIIQHLLTCSKSKEELQQVGFVVGQLLKLHYADFIELIRQQIPGDRRLACALGNTYLGDHQREEWKEFIALVNQYRTEDPFAMDLSGMGPWSEPQ
jgi:hypothetical protein